MGPSMGDAVGDTGGLGGGTGIDEEGEEDQLPASA